MNFEGLFAILGTAAICALLAWIVGLLLKVRPGVLGCIGAGLLGNGLGGWLAAALKVEGLRLRLTIGASSVDLVWTTVGALIVLLVAKFLPRWKR